MKWFLADRNDFEHLKNARAIRYMKILKFNLASIAAWDHGYIDGVKSKFTFAKKIYIFFLEYVFLVLGIMYISNNTGKLSFMELGHTYITVFLNVIACSRLILIFKESYHKLLIRFLNEIHITNYKDNSDRARQVKLTVHKLSHYFTIYLYNLGVIGSILFIFKPLYSNVSSGAYSTPRPENVTLQQAVYFEMPFDYKNNLRAHVLLFIYNIHIAYICMNYWLSFDLLISLNIFHVWGHLEILIKNLEHFPQPKCLSEGCKCYRFSEEEMKEVHNKLRDIVLHHNLILDFVATITDVFGWALLVYHAFHQVCICFLLLQCSQLDPNALTVYGVPTMGVFQQLIQMSVIFELLASQFEKLSTAMYNIPWEFMDTGRRKIVFIILQHMQNPVDLKAGSMVPIGVQTMATIIKTSFSYFIMLRTMADDK